ncbi:MAG: hypothetical protein V1797_14590 [Pseudomonadota bacterium]
MDISESKAQSIYGFSYSNDAKLWVNPQCARVPQRNLIGVPRFDFDPITVKPGFTQATFADGRLTTIVKCLAIEDPIDDTTAIIDSFIDKYGKKGLAANSEQCIVNFNDVIFPAYFIKYKGRYVIFEFIVETSRSSADKKEHTYLYAKLTDYFLLERLAGIKAHETENDKVVDKLKKTF